MPPQWAGFKFFNVYGPNEYHKGRMASVIMHTARQIKATGAMKLFRSHRPDFTDGGQSRDFIYVKDVVDTLLFFLENKPANAIYNLGTGQARTFLDLATATFPVFRAGAEYFLRGYAGRYPRHVSVFHRSGYEQAAFSRLPGAILQSRSRHRRLRTALFTGRKDLVGARFADREEKFS